MLNKFVVVVVVVVVAVVVKGQDLRALMVSTQTLVKNPQLQS